MSEREASRDLVTELRRVDDAFAGLKPGRDDVVERLLAGDTDELVQQSERRLRGLRWRRAAAVTGTFALALATIVAVRLLPAADQGAPLVAAPAPVPTSPTTLATGMRNVPAETPSAPPAMTPPMPPPTTPTTTPTTPTMTPSVPQPRQVWARPGSGNLRRVPGAVDGALAPVDEAAVQPLSLSPAATAPTSLQPLELGGIDVAAPVVVPVADSDVDEAVRDARRLARRGDVIESALVLETLLLRNPPARVVDVVTVEWAALLQRAGRTDEACAALRGHRARFPDSDNANVVAADLARWACP